VQVGSGSRGGASNAIDTPTGSAMEAGCLFRCSPGRAGLVFRDNLGDFAPVDVDVDVEGLDVGAADVRDQPAAARDVEPGAGGEDVRELPRRDLRQPGERVDVLFVQVSDLLAGLPQVADKVEGATFPPDLVLQPLLDRLVRLAVVRDGFGGLGAFDGEVEPGALRVTGLLGLLFDLVGEIRPCPALLAKDVREFVLEVQLPGDVPGDSKPRADQPGDLA